MPKVVDHAARRAELVRAVWRVVRREGVAGASVRATAREAGWSAGTVQHYFSDHAEMVAFAMEAIAEESARRVAGLPGPAGAQGRPEAALAVLESLAPFDPDARIATELWIAFLARGLVDARAREIGERGAADLRAECRRQAAALMALRSGPDGEVPDEEVETEALRMHALLDGLSIAVVSGTDTPDRARAVLRRHVEALAAGTGAGS